MSIQETIIEVVRYGPIRVDQLIKIVGEITHENVADVKFAASPLLSTGRIKFNDVGDIELA